MRGSIIRSLPNIKAIKEDEMGKAFSTHGSDKKCIIFWSDNMVEKYHLADLGVDMRKKI
jgi:hypothetical protein